jgi:hypothetical protein
MLNENALANRARQILALLAGMDNADQQAILEKTAEQLNIRLSNIRVKPEAPKSFGDKIRTAIDVGLSQANP